MALHKVVDSGGEYLLPFAKQKLEQLKQAMVRAGRRSMSKVYLVDDATRVYLSSLSVGNWQFIDRVRITAGALRYLFSASVSPSIVIDTEVTVNTITDYFANVTASILFPDGTKVAIPGGAGTISAHVFDTPRNNGVTWTNAPVFGSTPILTIKNGYADGVTDTTDLTNIDESTFIAATAFPTPTVGDAALSFVGNQFVSGHPTFSPAPISVFANGELMIVAQLEYTYDSGAGSFPPTGAVISKVSLVAANKYKYDAAATAWSFVGPLKLYDTVAGVRTEVAHLAHDTTTNYGNIVFVSENPLLHQGSTGKELETTYAAQVAILKPPLDPLAPFDILKFVKDALFA